MAAFTICSDFGAPTIKSLSLFPLCPHLSAMKWWDWMPWSLFSKYGALSHFTLLFHCHQKALSFSLLSAIRVVLFAYLRLLIFLPAILIPTCVSSSSAEFQKNIDFCFTDYSKAFDCVDHKKLWKILQEMGIPDHQICLLRNLYAGQEATVRIGHGTADWFQIRKWAYQGCMLSPC